MIAPTCEYQNFKGVGSARGAKRHKCLDCCVTFSAPKPKSLGEMRVARSQAQLALQMLTEGMSIRATERTTGIHRDTVKRKKTGHRSGCPVFHIRSVATATCCHHLLAVFASLRPD